MELYDVMFKRKSVRKLQETPLDAQALEGVLRHAGGLAPLLPGIPTAFGLIRDEGVSGVFSIKAPQYLALYSAKQEGYLLNAGFLLQQMDLYLSSAGLGACWLGMAKPKERVKDGLSFVMMLAFGTPDEALHRSGLSEFKRKPLAEISEGGDERLEAARLAPSAMNNQSWFFACRDGALDVYQAKPNPLKAAVLDRLNTVNSGIALCHLKLATERQGRGFSFTQRQAPGRKGFTYVGTV